MRSVVVHRQGGPEVLELVDGPVPEPGPTAPSLSRTGSTTRPPGAVLLQGMTAH